jgi:RNA polymerase sigma-70 factor, ECF subfamily
MRSGQSGLTMDSEAEFRRLYEANRAAVHAYFTGRTGDPQRAADLMQDTFLRAWQHLDALADMSKDRQRAWIFTVARNLSVDAHRHEHTRAGAQQALAREPSRPQQAASTAVIAAERVAVVGEAIRQLPDSQRVALTMAAAGGMTSTELAAALDVPAGTVRYRLSLARRAVAEALDRYDDPAEE